MGMIENLKDVVKLVQKLDNIELNEKILDLQSDALDLLDQRGKLERKNRQLEEELHALKSEQVTAAELFFERDCYWRTADAEPRTPYCSRCWDAGRSLIRMHRRLNGGAECPSCKTRAMAWPEEKKPPSPRRIQPSNWLSRRTRS